MALTKEYPADFERLWKVYPKWPAGRSKKEESYRAFAKAKKALDFNERDIEYIESNILERLRQCETWQKGNKFGPVMFSTFFNNHLWNEPYVKAAKHWTAVHKEQVQEERPRAEVDPEKVRRMLKETLGGLVH